MSVVFPAPGAPATSTVLSASIAAVRNLAAPRVSEPASIRSSSRPWRRTNLRIWMLRRSGWVIGGLTMSIVLGTGYGALFLPGVPPWILFLASFVIGIAGQAGDLFESLLKRAGGVKDSGTLLPGHGGMFDWADAVISAGPVLYLIALLAPLAGKQG